MADTLINQQLALRKPTSKYACLSFIFLYFIFCQIRVWIYEYYDLCMSLTENLDFNQCKGIIWPTFTESVPVLHLLWVYVWLFVAHRSPICSLWVNLVAIGCLQSEENNEKNPPLSWITETIFPWFKKMWEKGRKYHAHKYRWSSHEMYVDKTWGSNTLA